MTPIVGNAFDDLNPSERFCRCCERPIIGRIQREASKSWKAVDGYMEWTRREMVSAVAHAICKSRTFEGISCCQWPANRGRTKCPVNAGGYDDAARDAIEAMRVNEWAAQAATEIKSLRAQVELGEKMLDTVEANARVQATLLADTGRERDALRASVEKLQGALEWYRGEADAAARYMAQDKATTADALLAILTVLANDGGARASAAMSSDDGRARRVAPAPADSTATTSANPSGAHANDHAHRNPRQGCDRMTTVYQVPLQFWIGWTDVNGMLMSIGGWAVDCYNSKEAREAVQYAIDRGWVGKRTHYCPNGETWPAHELTDAGLTQLERSWGPKARHDAEKQRQWYRDRVPVGPSTDREHS